MTGNQCNLLYSETHFKKPTGALMAKVMKMQIIDFKITTLPSK
jgi:hypothetical protein